LRDLPLSLVPSIVAAAICFGILWFCILCCGFNPF
jgi:hypothetical protein